MHFNEFYDHFTYIHAYIQSEREGERPQNRRTVLRIAIKHLQQFRCRYTSSLLAAGGRIFDICLQDMQLALADFMAKRH